MLIDFTVKNYGPFKNETTLSAQTGERLRKYKKTNTFGNTTVPTLKNLILVGPNGSGKSQLLQALDMMRKLVIVGGTVSVAQKIPYYPFLGDDESRKIATSFAITLELQKKIYRYEFAYDTDEVHYEKLTILSAKSEQEEVYFERKGQDFLKLPASLTEIRQHLRKNALFLFLAQQNNDDVSSKIYSWFATDIIYLDSKTEIPLKWLELLRDNVELKQEMLAFLEFADFNITDIVLREVDIEQQDESSRTVLLPYTIHKRYDDMGNFIGQQEFPLARESLGTRWLFFVMLAIIAAKNSGNQKTIVIDELENSLHHELASALIKMFNSVENNNQFIVSTHDLQLLDNDLRIDQIYLVEKDFQGISSINSIFDFNDPHKEGRTDISYAKRYLSGRFGAMPVIDIEGLLQVFGDKNEETKK